MCRIAVVSVHTSPLARPGTRDSGGMNVYIRELSREMGRRAHTMDVFTRRVDPGLPQVTVIDERTRVVQVDAGPPDVDKAEISKYLPDFAAGVLEFQRGTGVRYDLVHSHYWLSGAVGGVLKAAWGVPLVVMFHTLAEAKNRYHLGADEPAFRIEGERAVTREADCIICATEGEREMLVYVYGVPGERVMVVPCGVDTQRFRPIDRARVRKRLGFAPDDPVVLFVGRIEPLKGIDVLLSVMGGMDRRFRLVVLGGDMRDAERKKELKDMAERLGIGDHVCFVDAVSHQALPLYYSAADVCVMPSHYESFGLVAVEAMACGVPVVASRVGGLKETVQDGRTGFLVPWRRPQGFAEKLDVLLGDALLRRRMGREARMAAERFRWSEVAHRVEDIYHELVSQYTGVAVGSHVA